MKNSEFDLELLQTHLLNREVPNISIGKIVRLGEGSRTIPFDDLDIQAEEFFRCGSHSRGVENMIVVATVVESHQLELEQLRNLVRLRVDHLHHVWRVLELPAHHEQIGIYLDVEEGQTIIGYFHRRLSGEGFFLGLSCVF